ncbi:MAG: sulfotransferase [Marinosulfonomonas sp.]|nr:sulfotransferase [Marinosulfonomonas sp.]
MFGIGATKAGTSWLFSYLEGHPECSMPPIKELGYFGLTQDKDYNWRIKKTRELVKELSGKLEWIAPEKEQAMKQRINTLRRWQKVLRQHDDGAVAYTEFMMREAKGTKLIADITPAYSMLAVSRLKQMAGLVAQTRFVYILRDPVDRLWSNIRMNAQRKSDNPELMRGYALAEVDEVLNGKHSQAYVRSDYAGGLETLEQAVAANKRKVLFYETLFSDDTIRDLCAFLGLSNHAARLNKRIHEGVPIKLDIARRNGLQNLLAPQYHAVEKRFKSLPAAWQENMARV